jgi:two-component system nitrogen regulation response regulator GlnG
LLPETVKFLQSLPWLGNVRELRNALEHAAIVARDEPLRIEHLPRLTSEMAATTPDEQVAASVRKWVSERVRSAGRDAPVELYQSLLRCVEPALLEEVMRRVLDNRWVAAQWLGLNRATVRKKLKEYGLTSVTGNGPEEENEPEA